MKVRLGQLIFIDPTPEELDELVRRYGCEVANGEGDEDAAKPSKIGQKVAIEGPRDSVVLRAFVEARSVGVPAKRIGSLLGRGGKATRGAARQWAARIGLTHDSNADPFEDCRVGTARGIRIKADLQDLAKELLKGGGAS
jgi:hypothetical protein